LIKDKKLGIFANHTSMIGNTHLVDTLKKLGCKDHPSSSVLNMVSGAQRMQAKKSAIT
jgi:hypothetical protein